MSDFVSVKELREIKWRPAMNNNSASPNAKDKEKTSGTVKASSVRFAVEPRDVPPEKAARRLHLTLTEFMAKVPQLLERGFPQSDPTTGMFDLKAIDKWMDRRSGLTAESATRDARGLVGRRIAEMGRG